MLLLNYQLAFIKKWVSYLYRTATTAYPCYLPVLGDFSRSWSYKTYPLQKYKLLPAIPKNAILLNRILIIQ